MIFVRSTAIFAVLLVLAGCASPAWHAYEGNTKEAGVLANIKVVKDNNGIRQFVTADGVIYEKLWGRKDWHDIYTPPGRIKLVLNVPHSGLAGFYNVVPMEFDVSAGKTYEVHRLTLQPKAGILQSLKNSIPRAKLWDCVWVELDGETVFGVRPQKVSQNTWSSAYYGEVITQGHCVAGRR